MAFYSVTVDENGASAPTFAAVLAGLKEKFRSIYGDDVYLEADSQDGEWLAFIASAINDCNAAIMATYASYSPASATGAGLSSVVKTNGITRASASKSSAEVRIVGQVGTVIAGGIVTGPGNSRWALPYYVTIGQTGEVFATVTAVEAGAKVAAPNTLTGIATPTRGWQSVANPQSAAPGAPVEKDGTLRIRQQQSVARPSRTIFDAIKGDLASLPGVLRVQGYENDTDATDANGIPEHSIALVVDGGDTAAIAGVIAARKTYGTGTYGTTSATVPNAFGVQQTYRFFRPTNRNLAVQIDATALPGYTTAVGDAIKAAVAAHINARAIGEDVYLGRLYVPAGLYGAGDASTFDINAIRIGVVGGAAPTPADFTIGFNEAAVCTVDNITLTVTT